MCKKRWFHLYKSTFLSVIDTFHTKIDLNKNIIISNKVIFIDKAILNVEFCA